MTSFDFDIPEKEISGADTIIRFGRKLAHAFSKKARSEKLTKAEIAQRLDIDKAAVSRMLAGSSNLTLRSFGELCWAIGVRPELHLEDVAVPFSRPNVAPHTVISNNMIATTAKPQIQVTAQ